MIAGPRTARLIQRAQSAIIFAASQVFERISPTRSDHDVTRRCARDLCSIAYKRLQSALFCARYAVAEERGRQDYFRDAVEHLDRAIAEWSNFAETIEALKFKRQARAARAGATLAACLFALDRAKQEAERAMVVHYEEAKERFKKAKRAAKVAQETRP